MMYNKAFQDLSFDIIYDGFDWVNIEGPMRLPIQQPDQIYQEYIIREDRMWEFQKHMTDRGIELLIRDTTPTHKLPGLGFSQSLPVTEAHAKSSVRLPTYPELTNQEVKQIIKAIKEFYV